MNINSSGCYSSIDQGHPVSMIEHEEEDRLRWQRKETQMQSAGLDETSLDVI